ncbi:MAG TPA: toast rack family protein [Bryobacteraceae bacterium]|nr:toast rack family protein [Bryobacteraceae bacterium]
MPTKLKLSPLLPFVLLLSACEIDLGRRGPTKTEPVAVELGKTEMARVELRMKVGEMKLTGGASKLIEGDLRYTDPEKPVVRSDSSGFRTTVSIDQPTRGHTSSRGDNYSWDLRLNPEVPLDLQLDFGVGQGKLNLGDLNLRTLDVHMGVGQLNVDLRGTPKHDYSVTIHGGVGQATVLFPAGAGIVADAHGGIGSIQVRGLEKDNGRYINSAYGHSKVTIRADVTGGIGEVRLIAE